ncbi:MAG: hypothetical protein WDZ79_00935 [Candidatus Paceibacterota bacterium]
MDEGIFELAKEHNLEYCEAEDPSSHKATEGRGVQEIADREGLEVYGLTASC